MGEHRTSAIATVMFTDVEASTDITTRLGDNAAAALLATTDRIVLDEVADHGGRDVRSTGDGFLVIFDSARAAVSCALAIQRELTDQEHPIRVRIGLNAGEVLGGGDELFGAAINLAARVMDRADGGQILATDTVRQLVGTVTGAAFHDRGRFALKGFAERQRLYEVRPSEARPERAPPARRSRRPRRTWALLGAAILAGAIAGAVALVHDSGSAAAIDVPANSVAVIDPRTRAVVDVIRVGESPGPVSAGAGGVWVLNLGSATLSRIDVRTRRLVETKGIGGTISGRGAPGNVAASAQEVWVSAAGCNAAYPGALLHVFSNGVGDLADMDDVSLAGAVREPRGRHEPPHGLTGCGLAARGTSAWVATNVPPGIARVDHDRVAGRSRVAWGRPLPNLTDTLAVGHGSVWAVDPEQHVIRRIDPKTGRITAQLHAGPDPVAIATDVRSVWVADAGENSVSRIDPRTNGVAQAIAVGEGPVALASGEGAVWVALGDAASVVRVDPRTNRVTATIVVGHRPQGIAVAGGLVWVTVRA
jgi:YVTN family beta-propeller protein